MIAKLSGRLDETGEDWAIVDVQGVGYDDPNRSHFRSIEIWETASKSDEFLEDGWLARAMGNKRSGDLLLDGVSVGEQDPGPMRGDPHILTFSNPEQMTRCQPGCLSTIYHLLLKH